MISWYWLIPTGIGSFILGVVLGILIFDHLLASAASVKEAFTEGTEEGVLKSRSGFE